MDMSLGRRMHFIIKRGVIPAVIIVTLASMFQTIGTKKVFADDAVYPWDGATCVDGSDCSATYNWGYALTGGNCPTNDSNCLSYPYPNGTSPTAGMGDTWGYGVRNCTSFVAWKINQVFGANINGWGQAADWDSQATGAGHPYTNDTSPQIGDIAQWNATTENPYGHVAYVYAVNSGVATLAEYNSGFPKNGSSFQWGLYYNGRTTASGSAGAPSNYIHIGTVSAPSFGFPSSAIFDFNSSENVVARGTNNESYANAWDGGWSGFTTMQSGATFAGNPTGIQYGTEGKVFVRGATTTNEIYESTWNGSAWGNFGSLESGATFASDPVAIQFDTSVLNLFAIGTDGQMYEISKDPGWGTFGTTIAPGAYFVGNPAVYKFGSNELVFARGTNNEIYQDTYTPGSGWSGFTTMGSGDTFASDPVPFVYDGVLNVFARGTDNQMYDSYYDTSWHAFSMAPNWSGAYFGGDPSVVQYGTEERLYSRAASMNNEIYESTWNGSSWSAFGSLQSGATFSSSPVALYYGGVLSVFAQGTDTKLYVISKDPDWGTFGEVQTGAEFNGFSWQQIGV